MSQSIHRVYFIDAPYVGTENYNSLPPLTDSSGERRAAWDFTESERGVTITYRHPGGETHSSFVPWSNIKGVFYAPVPTVPKSTESSTPAQGGKR